jgi:hypothetical protein
MPLTFIDGPSTNRACRMDETSIKHALAGTIATMGASPAVAAREMLQLAVGLLATYLGAEATASVLENSAAELRIQKAVIDGYQSRELNYVDALDVSDSRSGARQTHF